MSIEQAGPAATPLREMAAEVLRAWGAEWATLAEEFGSRIATVRQLAVTKVFFGRSELVVQPHGAFGGKRIAIRDSLDGTSPILGLQREILSGSPIALCFPPEEVLRLGVRLPTAKQSVLRKALGFELARLSPVPPEQLYFDFQRLISGQGKSELELKIRAIRKTAVDDAVAVCRAAGLKVAAIYLGDDGRSADWRAFPLDHRALLVASCTQFRQLALAALAGILSILVLVAVYARGEARLEAVSGQIVKAEVRATEVERLHARVSTLTRAQGYLAALKQRPTLIQALAELSSILPDDTWITDLQKTGKTLRIQGYSKSASRLVAEIAGSRRFVNAQFQAPLTRDTGTGAEHFDFSFEVSP